MPDLPTLTEVGYPGIDVVIWHGLVAPAGTPPAIIRKLNEHFVGALRLPEIERRITPLAVDIATSSPEAFGKLIAHDLALFAKAIKDAGIKQQ